MTQDLLKDVVYRRIRDLIINGTLPMGGKISESVLATRPSTTKAPVRDALKQLQSEGLVQIKPKVAPLFLVSAILNFASCWSSATSLKQKRWSYPHYVTRVSWFRNCHLSLII